MDHYILYGPEHMPTYGANHMDHVIWPYLAMELLSQI